MIDSLANQLGLSFFQPMTQSLASQWQEWLTISVYLSITLLVVWKVITTKAN